MVMTTTLLVDVSDTEHMLGALLELATRDRPVPKTDCFIDSTYLEGSKWSIYSKREECTWEERQTCRTW